MSSDREVVAAIKDRINLVDLIGRNVKLRRSGGSEWVGCCPFHGERTPSFYVIPNKQMAYCLAGETRVATLSGYQEIRLLAGKTLPVLTPVGDWISAPFRSYGMQRLWRIDLERNGVSKTLFATAEHRWLLRRVKTAVLTKDLVQGSYLEAAMSKPRDRWAMDPDGIRHGIIFGDGHVAKHCPSHGRAVLHGEKVADLIQWFEHRRMKTGERNGMPFASFGGPFGHMKALPPIDSHEDYILGFMAGWIATDGHVAKDGTVMLNCAHKENLEAARSLLLRLGITTHSITMQMRKGYLAEEAPLYRIHLVRGGLAPEFFLRSESRRRFEASPVNGTRERWRVVSVQPTDRMEEVFCCEVPIYHAFVLEDGIVTGNCFGGCGHFDAFSYLMRQENLTFPEALEQLAAQAGVELPKRETRDQKREEAVDRLRAVLEESQAFFAAQMVSEEDAMCYLQGRGLTSDFVTEIGLGVAPPTWDMLSKHLQSQGFKDEDIVAAGVGAVGQRGGIIDAMRNRVTIPIRDHRGKLVAFGGRILDDGKPKYLNTKETPLFNKGEVLFGLHEAKAHLQEGALVVEGYFDVLTLQMLGLKMAVAPLGTALTEAHLDRLLRYTKRLTLCFDGDAAGHKAMEKSLQLALPKGFDVRLLELPDGEDPDTWAMRVGADAFRELIQKAPDWTSFKIQRAIKDRDMRKTPERMAVLGEITPLFAYVPQEARETFSATLAHLLQLPLSEVQRIAGNGHSSDAPQPPKEAPKEPAVDPSIQVDEAIKALTVAWIDPATKATIQGTPRDWWLHLGGACLLEEILDDGGAELSTASERLFREAEARHSIGRIPNVARLLSSLELAYIEAQLRQLRMGMEDPKTPPEAIPDYEKAQLSLLERRMKLNRRASN